MKMKTPNLNKKVAVTTPMELELEAEVRMAAAKLGVSRAELIRRAVIEFLHKLSQQDSSNDK